MIQGGDPTGTGRGGSSVYGFVIVKHIFLLFGFLFSCYSGKFEDEIHPGLKHVGAGILSMVCICL